MKNQCLFYVAYTRYVPGQPSKIIIKKILTWRIKTHTHTDTHQDPLTLTLTVLQQQKNGKYLYTTWDTNWSWRNIFAQPSCLGSIWLWWACLVLHTFWGPKMTTAGRARGSIGWALRRLRLPSATFVAAILHTLNLMNCRPCVCASALDFLWLFNNLACLGTKWPGF